MLLRVCTKLHPGAEWELEPTHSVLQASPWENRGLCLPSSWGLPQPKGRLFPNLTETLHRLPALAREGRSPRGVQQLPSLPGESLRGARDSPSG